MSRTSKKKKLLYIVESMGGGVFTYIVSMANELVRTYDLYVAYGLRPETPANYESYFHPAVHLIRVKSFKRQIDPVQDVKAFWEIRRIGKIVEPDVIHLHSSKAGALGRLAFNGKRVPLFYTPHGYSFLMNNCSRIKRLFYREIEALCARRRCVTLSCSAGEHQESVKLTKWGEQVDSGIDPENLKQILSSEKNIPHPFTVFTLGRIDEQKNPDLFNKIAKSMPDVQFLWIGDGHLREHLNAPNIQVTGWMEHREALQRGFHADVFILTSLWEGLPIALLEAMYMKKLCIVSNNIGNRDVIHHGENGFVCNSVNDYVIAINLARNGEGAEQTERAYSEILNHYNIKSMAEQYASLYETYWNKIHRIYSSPF